MREYLRQYSIIFPGEHGSWSLMIMPFIIGGGVAAALGRGAPLGGLGVALCFVAAMGVFLARQPINLWLRIRRGRGPKSRLPLARFWAGLLVGIAGLAGIGLLALGRWPLLWLVFPAVFVLTATLIMTVMRGPRQLSTELVGTLGLALSAPAAYVSATGTLEAAAWIVWGISALHNVISVLYVRLRIDEQHGRATTQQAVWVIVAHVLSLAIVITAWAGGWLPWLVALPVALLLVRALMVALLRPPIEDVRRFGFTEVGLGLAFALLIIAAFVIAG